MEEMRSVARPELRSGRAVAVSVGGGVGSVPGVEGVDESEWWDDRVRDGGRSAAEVEVVRLREAVVLGVEVEGASGEKRAA